MATMVEAQARLAGLKQIFPEWENEAGLYVDIEVVLPAEQLIELFDKTMLSIGFVWDAHTSAYILTTGKHRAIFHSILP